MIDRLSIAADFGGTSARIGTLRGGRLDPESIRRFANADFDAPVEVLRAYLDGQKLEKVRSIALAVAGPVVPDLGKLTNRGWTFRPTDFAEIASQVYLVNDLWAIGNGLFDKTQGTPIVAPPHCAALNGQALVIGVGTGFNICQVLRDGSPVRCAASEYGHTALPMAIRQRLGNYLPNAATVEEVFSGRGYAELRSVAGESAQELIAGLLALQTQELVLGTLPFDGIWFAGGVARAVLAGAGHKAFSKAFSTPLPIGADPRQIPVTLITDDFAGLYGCARFLVEQNCHQK